MDKERKSQRKVRDYVLFLKFTIHTGLREQEGEGERERESENRSESESFRETEKRGRNLEREKYFINMPCTRPLKYS